MQQNFAHAKILDHQNQFFGFFLGTGKQASWNGVHCCGSAVENKVNDISFLVAVREELATWLPIDRAHG